MVEAEVFHMLVERLGNVEDTLSRIECRLSTEDEEPRHLEDLRPEYMRRRVVENENMRLLDVLTCQYLGPGTLIGSWLLSQSRIDMLKRNGFLVFVERSGTNHYICWDSDEEPTILKDGKFDKV